MSCVKCAHFFLRAASLRFYCDRNFIAMSTYKELWQMEMLTAGLQRGGQPSSCPPSKVVKTLKTLWKCQKMFQLLDTTSYNDFAVSLKKFRLVPALFESKNQNVNWLQLQFSSLLHLFRVHFFRASWVTRRPFTIPKSILHTNLEEAGDAKLQQRKSTERVNRVSIFHHRWFVL